VGSPRRVSLQVPDEPLVSVVMLLYGGGEIACRAISALAEKTEPCFEVVLVDNASPDDALARVEARIEGATIIRNEVNRGFGTASNQGAERARGRFLCFLNSDALVEDGWLEPLLEAVDEPEVGAAVPLFLNENGTVQEAGSVVDSIGHAHAVGGNGNPRDLQYRFRRTVDFGSAACMVVERALFLELGGFDEIFSPAYFEDTDLCFRMHERELSTVFEPRSRVTHIRHGSGTSESARKLMEQHRGLFLERWAERLGARPRVLEAAQNPNQMLVARDADALDRLLVIDDRVPHADRGSGDPRMAALLAELAALWPAARITLAAADGREAERYAEPLLHQGIEVVCPPVDWEHWFKERRFHYGVVIVSRQQNVSRFEGFLSLTQPQALRVFDTEALSFQRFERLAELLPPGKQRSDVRSEAMKTRLAEVQAVQVADVVLCVSDDEAKHIAELAPGKSTFVLPGIVEPRRDPPGFDERRDVLFYGGFLAGSASPNEDALRYLIAEVLPLFWQNHPDVAVNVVGADVADSVRALEAPGVRIVGYVDDPAEWLARARLHVNPMRFGAGLKQKFLDSLAEGLPFVTTTVGAEGFPLGDVRGAMVADDPAGLASRMGRLYEDRAEWERVQAYLLDLAGTRFDRSSFRRNLIEALTHVGVAPPRRATDGDEQPPAGQTSGGVSPANRTPSADARRAHPRSATGVRGETVETPPVELIVRVVGTSDVEAFVRSGYEHVDQLAEILGRAGYDLQQFRDIYDFGCGCGRLTRALRDRVPEARLTATDIDEEAIAWLAGKMPGVTARVNPWLPPLPFADGAFDLVIAFSVFTHLPEDYQDAWLAELQRVTRPGAVLVVTVHGESHWRRTWDVDFAAAPKDVRRHSRRLAFRRRVRGFAHWRGDGWERTFPDFYHTTWHRPGYVRKHWSRWFEVLNIEEATEIGNHDLVVLRRR
jgi:GT2 family glycosyltransferase/SAM-dependent methyltransferase/glycosyltransferase involved in cell wall biosynthesis